jgi:hypothetical protein
MFPRVSKNRAKSVNCWLTHPRASSSVRRLWGSFGVQTSRPVLRIRLIEGKRPARASGSDEIAIHGTGSTAGGGTRPTCTAERRVAAPPPSPLGTRASSNQGLRSGRRLCFGELPSSGEPVRSHLYVVTPFYETNLCARLVPPVREAPSGMCLSEQSRCRDAMQEFLAWPAGRRSTCSWRRDPLDRPVYCHRLPYEIAAKSRVHRVPLRSLSSSNVTTVTILGKIAYSPCFMSE